MQTNLEKIRQNIGAYRTSPLINEAIALLDVMIEQERNAAPVYCTPTEYEGRIVYEHTDEPLPNADSFKLYRCPKPAPDWNKVLETPRRPWNVARDDLLEIGNLFYLQDGRSYVGNDVLWWANRGGYTTDVSMAKTFTKEEAQRLHDLRVSDIPWPKSYIDRKTRPAVDMQYINRSEALNGGAA